MSELRYCPARFDVDPCELRYGHEGDHFAVRMTGKRIYWPRLEPRSERGSAGAIALLFAILAVAPLGAMRWLGPVWAGGLVVAVALVWLAVGCCTAPAGLRDRLDAEAPKGGAL